MRGERLSVSNLTYAQFLAVALRLEVVLIALTSAIGEHLAFSLLHIEVPALYCAEALRSRLAHFHRHSSTCGDLPRLARAALVLFGDYADVAEMRVAALRILGLVGTLDGIVSGGVSERLSEGTHIDGSVEVNCKGNRHSSRGMQSRLSTGFPVTDSFQLQTISKNELLGIRTKA